MNAGNAGFWLNDVFVNTSERRIMVGDRLGKVEPKAMAVLVVLADNPGTVVTRSALFDAVWPGAQVSDEVLSRCIYQLRRALSDNSTEPEYIETIPKEGYRLLIQPTREHHSDIAAEAPARRTAVGLWLIPIIAAIGFASVFIFREPPGLPQPWVTVTPITVSPDDVSLAVLGLALNDRLRAAVAELDGSGGVRIEWRPGSEIPVELNPDGPQYIVHGRLTENPGEPNVLLSLYIDNLGGDERVTSPLNVFEVPRIGIDTPIPRVEAYREAIIDRLRYYLTVELPFIHYEFSPVEMEAFRLIMYADWELYSGKDCGIGARPLLERATDLSPDTPRGWAQLAEAHWAQVWGCGKDGSHIAAARAALAKSLEIDPDYVAAHYLQAIIDTETGNVENAWSALQPRLAEAPDDKYLAYAAMEMLVYAGFLSESTALVEDMMLRDPLALSADMVDLPLSLLYAGDYETFLALAPTKPIDFMRYHRALAFAMTDRKDRASALLARVRTDESRSVFTDYAAALEAWLADDPDTILAIVETIRARREHAEPVVGAAAFREAQLLALAGAEEMAEAAVAQAVDAGFFCVTCFRTAVSFNRLTGRREFEAALERAESRHRAFAKRFGLPPQLPIDSETAF